jgi:hypothetical protein
MDATTTIEKSAAVEPAPSADGKRLSVEEKGDVVELVGSYTEEEERRVLRKIDYTILPMMCFIFFLQYLDKQTLSYASVSLSRSLFTGASSLLTVPGLWAHHRSRHDEQTVLMVLLYFLHW